MTAAVGCAPAGAATASASVSVTNLANKRTLEQRLDRVAAVLLQRPRADARKVWMQDRRAAGIAVPRRARPREPAALLLIEDVERLVTQLCELCAPSGTAADGAIFEHRADDIDFLAVVHLIPDRLQD